MKLESHSYGKSAVRVLKVIRDGARQSVKELDVSVTLSGDFDASYTGGDNSAVIPTDTIKNTVQVLAFKHLGHEAEEFGVLVAEHFLKTYSQATRAEVELRERPWARMTVAGNLHPHSFCEAGTAVPIINVTSAGNDTTVTSGIEGLLMLKTTGSGFEGFARDAMTTLTETKERVLATKLDGRWVYRGKPAGYSESNGRIIRAMMDVFVGTYSPSVQATLYEMCRAALNAAPEVERISLKLPNKHYLLANLAPFGLENRDGLFVPTDEPFGRIEGTVVRDG